MLGEGVIDKYSESLYAIRVIMLLCVIQSVYPPHGQWPPQWTAVELNYYMQLLIYDLHCNVTHLMSIKVVDLSI